MPAQIKSPVVAVMKMNTTALSLTESRSIREVSGTSILCLGTEHVRKQVVNTSSSFAPLQIGKL